MKIIGHEKIINYLQKQIQSEQLAGAYLFLGPEGVGKFLIATEFARWLNKLSPETPVERRGIIRLNPEIATALSEKKEKSNSIGIEAVRWLQKELSLKIVSPLWRVVIIEESEKISSEAANAFLKTLEEPPANTLIILLATSRRNLPLTVISRCQILRFSPLSEEEISQFIEEQFPARFSAEEKKKLSRRAAGSLSRCLELLSSPPAVKPDIYLDLPEYPKGKEREMLEMIFNEYREKFHQEPEKYRPLMEYLFRIQQALNSASTNPRFALDTILIQLRNL